MRNYYSQKLSAERLRLCYEIAPPRVKRYLEAEIYFVLDRIKPFDLVFGAWLREGRGNFRKRGMGKALLRTAEEDESQRRQRFGGLGPILTFLDEGLVVQKARL